MVLKQSVFKYIPLLLYQKYGVQKVSHQLKLPDLQYMCTGLPRSFPSDNKVGEVES